MLIKDDKSVSSSNKLDSLKVDDMLSQIINESLMDNTSPLPSQFTTNNYYKSVCGFFILLFIMLILTLIHVQKEETKSPSSIIVTQDMKKEYSEWPHNDRNTSSRTPSSHRSSSAELAEKESQELIRDLLVLNQLSSSCSSRNAKDNVYKKHSASIPMYSSRSPDTVVSSPLGVIHHPAYRNSYSTVCISYHTEIILSVIITYKLF